MKVYQDLVIRGNALAQDRFIVDLQKRLSDGWERHFARESEVVIKPVGSMYCFSCPAAAGWPPSELWITPRSDGALCVSNIVPQKTSSLTYDQYNAILQVFHDRFARPAAQTAGVEVELGNSEPRIEDFLSDTTASLLRSGVANRSISHPLDRKRWNEFLAAAYREAAPLTASMLQRWLIEEEKWPEDQAIDLASEYDRSQSLLEVYESRPA